MQGDGHVSVPETNNDQSSEVNADKFYSHRPVQILQH